MTPKANVLVIDDTPENLNLLSQMLTQQGYKVRSVTKGSTGLRGAQAAPPDLILLDVNMPEMNGYEVCQQLKEDERTKDIPVIFISALGDVLDKVKAFAVGGVDYITKPFQVEEVLARIEIHLKLQHLQKQLIDQNTQLQREMQERKQAEEKFAKAFRASPNPIAIITLPEGRLLDVNPSFLKMSGYHRKEVVGQTAMELGLVQKTAAIGTLLQHLSTTESLYNQEFEFRTQSGETKVLLVSVEAIKLSCTNCLLLIANDITERQRLENEFISLVSHELRTPLTSLVGALDLLDSGQLGDLNPQGQNVLRIATTNTERLIRLVNNILDLERMKTGTIAMQTRHCNAGDLAIQATESMEALAKNSDIAIVVKPYPIEFQADPDRILQTLTNLLSNAIKFSDPGSSVELAVNQDNSQVIFTVKDTGRGIPADKLQVIFERFQQVDASDSRQKGGSGLGLAICRKIVEQHRGNIWVESRLGEGSTFSISLPLHSP
jgi:PAS domain S-box-containing protein